LLVLPLWSTRTRGLLVEEGRFVYDSDSYTDKVPHFTEVEGHQHLGVPYTPDANEIAFWAVRVHFEDGSLGMLDVLTVFGFPTPDYPRTDKRKRRGA
jgi:hypothetical protein